MVEYYMFLAEILLLIEINLHWESMMAKQFQDLWFNTTITSHYRCLKSLYASNDSGFFTSPPVDIWIPDLVRQ